MNQVGSRVIPAAHISREASETLIAAALSAAKQANIEVSIAVVDGSGALRGFARADGASAMTADVAIGKAWTSATSGYPSHIWNQIVANPRFGPLTNLPRMMAVSGGLPIIDNGQVVGAIGVSGGQNDQDRDAALMALHAAGFST
jgi:uncharacterized protein GlcG (DUF336 family)